MYKDDSLTLHTDLYQINMMQVYFNQGIHNKKAVFEVYFRQLPFKNGFAVFAGLEHIVNYLENLTFSETDIAYLKDLGYPKDFLDYLANLKLELTINSALEGDLVFANEPIFQVEGPLAQCQLVETALLNILNYQILIATKAARIRSVIEDAPLLEFGTQLQMYVQVRFSVFLFQVLMPMPLFKLMETIMMPLKPMHLLIKTAYFLWIPMIPLRLVFQMLSAWLKS